MSNFVRKMIVVDLGDRKITLTKLTLLELQQIQEHSKVLHTPEANWIDYVNGTAPFIEASVRRASPNASAEDMRTVLDLDSWKIVWSALMNLSSPGSESGEEKPATA